MLWGCSAMPAPGAGRLPGQIDGGHGGNQDAGQDEEFHAVPRGWLMTVAL